MAVTYVPYWSLLIGIGAIGFAIYHFFWVKKQNTGTEKMHEIAAAIRLGAQTFLKREYKTLVFFVLVVGILLASFISSYSAVAYVIGAFCSVIAGYIGMQSATQANLRTAWAARTNLNYALRIAFSGGTVLGLTIVGIGLIGVIAVYLILHGLDKDLGTIVTILAGFSFGASSVALFARVGGGIYTKGADVGADLVGKVEAGIPEDDPRNPAVIADNVGDNVGDIAGMGADLFESYVASLIAAMTIGIIEFSDNALLGLMLPIAVYAVGVLASILGSFFVRAGKTLDSSFQKQTDSARRALNNGTFTTVILSSLGTFVIFWLFKSHLANTAYTHSYLGLFVATLSGILAGLFIGLVTEYYTSDRNKPVNRIVQASSTGPATNIISGLAVGMESTALPIIIVSVGLFIAYKFGGLFGIPMASVGLLSTIGMVLSVDGYGPISDNAAGIAEMAELGHETRARAEALDAVGNTTAAIGKGFAISSAAFSTFALFWAYTRVIGTDFPITLNSPDVIIGLFIGGLLPVIVSAFTMGAVGKAGFEMVKEVRRQFKEIPGLMEGKAKADYSRCVDISTKRALQEMLVPGLIVVITPILLGLLLGPGALGGALAGSMVTGFVFAVFMANSGGAWDNAKKYIEAGNMGGKGSDPHKAAVVGDTVGDPFKDTSGPSLNILIKLMSIIALVIAPMLLLIWKN